ncbi:hypothetical protein ACIP4Y_08225 [Streptomyces sp. NPDC088810]|uniref:hypothetical protein n=1 Tax=Streptomyces sp. NPDC088810 TaxID=3365904 RepID=UPI0037F6D08D
MSGGRAAEIARGTTVDVGDVTTRFLLCGLLPAWFVPGLADWVLHRRTRIEDTAGTRESLIPALMMAEVGAPIALTLRYGVNPLLLSVQLGAAAVHEATALWDVRTAVRSDREVKPVEQHIHGSRSACVCCCRTARSWCGAGGRRGHGSGAPGPIARHCGE